MSHGSDYMIQVMVRDSAYEMQNHRVNVENLLKSSDLETGINLMSRCILIDWLYEIHSIALNAQASTMLLTVSLIDKLLLTARTPRLRSFQHFQLTGICSFRIITKFEEMKHETFKDTCFLMDDKYSEVDIENHENEILEALHYDFNTISLDDSVQIMLSYFGQGTIPWKFCTFDQTLISQTSEMNYHVSDKLSDIKPAHHETIAKLPIELRNLKIPKEGQDFVATVITYLIHLVSVHHKTKKYSMLIQAAAIIEMSQQIFFNEWWSKRDSIKLRTDSESISSFNYLKWLQKLALEGKTLESLPFGVPFRCFDANSMKYQKEGCCLLYLHPKLDNFLSGEQCRLVIECLLVLLEIVYEQIDLEEQGLTSDKEYSARDLCEQSIDCVFMRNLRKQYLSNSIWAAIKTKMEFI